MNHPSPKTLGNPKKPQNFKSAISDILRYCKRWSVPILVSLVFSVGSTVLSVIAPDKMADLTNAISAGLATEIDIDGVKSAIISILLGTAYLHRKLPYDKRHAATVVEPEKGYFRKDKPNPSRIL